MNENIYLKFKKIGDRIRIIKTIREEKKMGKFSELTDEEKAKEIDDYIKGWKETHPNETFSIEEVTKLCIDSEDD